MLPVTEQENPNTTKIDQVSTLVTDNPDAAASLYFSGSVAPFVSQGAPQRLTVRRSRECISLVRWLARFVGCY